MNDDRGFDGGLVVAVGGGDATRVGGAGAG